ncbi:MAG: enoyl-CoA hydratase/isomerase family protein [Rhodospirillales bacterium]
MTESFIHAAADGPVATVRIDRPALRNALSLGMAGAIAEAVETFDADPAIRVIAIRGSDEWFSAGADLKELPPSRETAKAARDYDTRISAAVARLAACRTPTVALLNGPVIGGASAFAVACDMRVAARRCYFRIPVARNGLFYAPVDARRLLALVGPGIAKWMMMSGETVSSEQALTWGLITALYDDDTFDDESRRLLETIAAGAPLSLRYTKLTLDAPSDETDLTAEAYERIYASPDPREGLAAVREKRTPRFRGDG